MTEVSPCRTSLELTSRHFAPACRRRGPRRFLAGAPSNQEPHHEVTGRVGWGSPFPSLRKPLEFIDISTNKRFFLGAAPPLDLLFSLPCRVDRLKFLDVSNGDRWINARGAASASAEMISHPTFEIPGGSIVDSPRGKTKNVKPGRQGSPQSIPCIGPSTRPAMTP